MFTLAEIFTVTATLHTLTDRKPSVGPRKHSGLPMWLHNHEVTGFHSAVAGLHALWGLYNGVGGHFLPLAVPIIERRKIAFSSAPNAHSMETKTSSLLSDIQGGTMEYIGEVHDLSMIHIGEWCMD